MDLECIDYKKFIKLKLNFCSFFVRFYNFSYLLKKAFLKKKVSKIRKVRKHG